MPSATRILYLVPERQAPTGGVNTSFEHVAILSDAGFNARVLQFNSAAPYTHAGVDAPTLFLDRGAQFHKGDVLVLPEGSPEFYREMAALPHMRRFVFCQNHFYFLHTLGQRADWDQFGIEGVFACSAEAAASVGRTVGLAAVPVVPCAVDPAVFTPQDKKRQIAYMPRKMAQEVTSIRNIFSWRYPALADVPWVPIDGVSRTEAARILGESAVYLSTSWYEGLGLPPLEAMACGCVVVGFHGWGGLDYVRPGNGMWCEEGNIDIVPDALAEVLEMWEQDSPALESVRSAGAATAERYSPQAMRDALLALWSHVIGC